MLTKICFAILIVCVASQATIPCTYTDPSTQYTYDLSGLANDQYDYIVQILAGTDNYTTMSYETIINVCRPIRDQSCSSQAGSNCDACQVWPLGAPKYANAIGSTTATTIVQAQDTSGTNGQGVTMNYGGFTSTLKINFVCDPNTIGTCTHALITYPITGFPTYVTKPTTSTFLFQWKTKYACAVSSGSSKSRLYCDCEKADVTLCSDSSCPESVYDLCTYECYRFGGIENSSNNYCNYNTNSDFCS